MSEAEEPVPDQNEKQQEEEQTAPNDPVAEPAVRRNRFVSHAGELIITPPPAASSDKQ